ncbi:MAG TPA: hypothetical protein PLK82_12425 [Bacteroidales bacterium]|nr:hypothetical protein [Bacteroidales bacterium]
MNTREIEEILARYFDGESTLAEEGKLREFFSGDEVPPHLEPYRPLFAFFTDENREEPASPGFEQRLTAALESHGAGKVVVMQPHRHRILFISSIAATVLLLIGIFFTLRTGRVDLTAFSKPDPEVERAWNDTRGALLLLSGNFNHGLGQAERLQTVGKALENLTLFNKFYQYQPVIINQDDRNGTSIK